MTGLVLMYHRVAALASDPYGLAVHPDRFAQHVEVLEGLASVVPLSEVVGPGRAPRVALTFDDGYVDNVTVAAPLLTAAQLPATYFITTGRLGGQPFWWDRLAEALLHAAPPPGLDVHVAGRDLWLSLDSEQDRRSSLLFLHRRLRPLPPDELAAAVEGLLAQVGVGQGAREDASMTRAQLVELSHQPGVSIGGHTRTHLQLAGQRERLQREEVVGSVEDLRGLLDVPIEQFAFPFGSPSAVGELAPSLARESGCALACTTDHGVVRDSSSPWQLPRVNVLDWTGQELADVIRHEWGTP